MTNGSRKYFINPDEIDFIDLMPGVKSRILTGLDGGTMMMALTTIEPGSAVPTHAHPHEQIGMVFAGRASFRIGNEEREVSRNDFFSIPSNVDHEATCISSEPFIAIDIFFPIRDDMAEKARKLESSGDD
jgi:quercetin dioxygenase-like cupin family protein